MSMFYLSEIRKSINPRQKSQIIDLVFKTSAAQPSVTRIILFYRIHSRHALADMEK